MGDKTLFTPEESGALLGVSPEIIRELIESSELAALCGGKYIHRQELRRFGVDTFEPPQTRLLTDYVRYAYENIIRDEQEVTTLASYENDLLYIYRWEPFREMTLGEVKAADVKNFLDNVKLKNGSAPCVSVKRKVKFLLNRVLETAVEEGLLDRNPMNPVKNILNGSKSRAATEKSRAGAIPLPLLKSAMRVIKKSERYFPIIVTLLHTGLRIGELIALEWRCIDFKRGVIRVEQSYKRVRDPGRSKERYKGWIGEPKTAGSRREIYVHASLLEMLKLRKAGSGGCRLVFPTKRGELDSYSSLRRGISKYWQAHGVEPHSVHFHLFRHSYGTYMEAAGVKESVCRALMGHSGEGDAHGVYIDVLPKQKRKAAAMYYAYMRDVFEAE
jgi:integrase